MRSLDAKNDENFFEKVTLKNEDGTSLENIDYKFSSEQKEYKSASQIGGDTQTIYTKEENVLDLEIEFVKMIVKGK